MQYPKSESAKVTGQGLPQRIDKIYKIGKIQQLKVLAMNFISVNFICCVVWLLRHLLLPRVVYFTCRRSWMERGGGVTVLISLSKTVVTKIIVNNPIFMTKSRRRQAKNRSLMMKTIKKNGCLDSVDERRWKYAQASDRVTELLRTGSGEVWMTETTTSLFDCFIAVKKCFYTVEKTF